MKILLWFFIFYTPNLFAEGGSTIGNGGDLVECRNPISKVMEYKSLDYLLTLDTPTDSDYLKVQTLSESLSQIQTLLDHKLPELAGSFRQFVQYLWNTNSQFPIVWEKSAFGVTPINDEELGSAHLVPEYCRTEIQGKRSMSLVQAVVRLRERFSPESPKRFYAFMPELIQLVEKKDPLQVSFLLVHEWLWDWSKNVERNRRINRLLHSPSFHQLSSENIKSQLQSLGFALISQEESLFEGEFCQATSNSIKELLLKKNQLSLGKYILLRRSRFCSAQIGCSSFAEIETDTLRGGFMAPYFSKGNFIKMFSTTSTKMHPASTCEFNRRGEILCSPFKEFIFNGKAVVLKGFVSSECAHLKAFIQYKEYGENWNETQFVLWSLFKD